MTQQLKQVHLRHQEWDPARKNEVELIVDFVSPTEIDWHAALRLNKGMSLNQVAEKVAQFAELLFARAKQETKDAS